MRLPTGYTQLEYIESSGAQCINAVVSFDASVYNQLKLEYDMQILSSNGANAWAVAGTGGQIENIFYVGTQGGVLWYGNGTTDISTGIPYDYSRQTWILDAYNGVFSVGSLANIYYTPNRPSISLDIYLFAYRSANGYVGHKARLYRAKISNGGVLIRDFIPCISLSGEIGLYDLVNSQFYKNAGTGAFAAGPEIKLDIDTPGGFRILEQDNETAVLVWEPVPSADGYRLYRNGILVQDTKKTQVQIAVGRFFVADFAVTAYIDDLESSRALLRVCSSPVADPLPYLIFTRTKKDVISRNALGTYNATDLNRVSETCNYIRNVFTTYGYNVPEILRTDWKDTDIPWKSDMEKYIRVIRTLSGLVRFMPVLPDLPQTMERFGFGSANAIEEMLYHLGDTAEKIPSTWVPCGTVFCGGIY